MTDILPAAADSISSAMGVDIAESEGYTHRTEWPASRGATGAEGGPIVKKVAGAFVAALLLIGMLTTNVFAGNAYAYGQTCGNAFGAHSDGNRGGNGGGLACGGN